MKLYQAISILASIAFANASVVSHVRAELVDANGPAIPPLGSITLNLDGMESIDKYPRILPTLVQDKPVTPIPVYIANPTPQATNTTVRPTSVTLNDCPALYELDSCGVCKPYCPGGAPKDKLTGKCCLPLQILNAKGCCASAHLTISNVSPSCTKKNKLKHSIGVSVTRNNSFIGTETGNATQGLQDSSSGLLRGISVLSFSVIGFSLLV